MSKKIMVQGTMSNAGKSLITAGLLRVFAKDGNGSTVRNILESIRTQVKIPK